MNLIDLRDHQFSALIFDCDGTLADTAPLHFRSMESAVNQQGHQIAREWYFARVGLSRRDLFRDFDKSHGVTLDHQQAVDQSIAFFHTVVHQAKPIIRTVNTARAHFGQVPMAVASGAEADLVRASLTAIGAINLFSDIVTVTDVGIGKPAPNLFLEAARRLEIAPQDCLVFEDSDEGMEAAERASMNAIDVRQSLVPKAL